jgi:hypothetical protein
MNGVDYPGLQQPLITKEVFNLVQQKMHRRQPTLRTKHNPIYKNLIQCKMCGKMITWQQQKGNYYGACQRIATTCKHRKFIREDKVEAIVINELKKLVCPSPAVIEWVKQSIQESHTDNFKLNEQTANMLRDKIERVKRMDNGLYDDKLAGDISKDKYSEKHDLFVEQLGELNNELDRLDITMEQRFKFGLRVIDVSQQAAVIYAEKSPEEKRLIITKLFQSIVADNDTISVNLTPLAAEIAKNSEKTRKVLSMQNTIHRTIKKAPDNRGNDEAITPLCAIWQGLMDDYRTYCGIVCFSKEGDNV